MISYDFELRPRRGHSASMQEAVEALHRAGIRFTQPNPHQLKVGDLNFYPTTGKITRDGGPSAWPEGGLDVLIAHLRNQVGTLYLAIDEYDDEDFVPPPSP